MKEESGYSYFIATNEKALCDAVYKVPSAVSFKEIETLLLEDWRMERSDLVKLDYRFIEWIAPLYRRNSVRFLAQWLKREKS